MTNCGVQAAKARVPPPPPPLATSKQQDEAPPVGTADKPQQPEIKVAPEGGTSIARPQPSAPSARSTTSQPTGTPQGTPPTGGNPLGKLTGPAIGAATTVAGIGTDKALRSSPFDAAIDKALNSGDRGIVLEGTVATYVKPDLVAFQKEIGPSGSLGEIDVETNAAIIEVTTASKKKLDQVSKYLNDPTFNPDSKPVILYAPNYNHFAEKDIVKAGGYVVRTREELLELLEQLKQKGRF